MEDEPLSICGFGDAVSTLMGIHEDFGYAHAVALIDTDGRVLDLVVFAERMYSIDAAIGWAICETLEVPDVQRLVFFSCEDGGTAELREQDVRKAEELRSAFADSGFEVVDWLFADGELMRSIACSIGWDTWDVIHAGRYADRDEGG